jgi:hypothetical protein
MQWGAAAAPHPPALGAGPGEPGPALDDGVTFRGRCGPADPPRSEPARGIRAGSRNVDIRIGAVGAPSLEFGDPSRVRFGPPAGLRHALIRPSIRRQEPIRLHRPQSLCAGAHRAGQGRRSRRAERGHAPEHSGALGAAMGDRYLSAKSRTFRGRRGPANPPRWEAARGPGPALGDGGRFGGATASQIPRARRRPGGPGPALDDGGTSRRPAPSQIPRARSRPGSPVRPSTMLGWSGALRPRQSSGAWRRSGERGGGLRARWEGVGPPRPAGIEPPAAVEFHSGRRAV